jgi:hypothetical protein
MDEKPRNETDAAAHGLGVVSGRSQESPRPFEWGPKRLLRDVLDPAAIRRRKRYETVRRAKAFRMVLNERWRKTGYTSKRIAELAKINHDVLRSWLSRGLANPADDTMPAIHRLCKVLRLKPDELLCPLNDQDMRIEFRVAALLPRLTSRQMTMFENMLDALESDADAFDRLASEASKPTKTETPPKTKIDPDLERLFGGKKIEFEV